jgi:hypothetical protein
MKAKKFSKKLALNKETVSNLKSDEMKDVYGGIGLTKKWSNCIVCTAIPYNCHT